MFNQPFVLMILVAAVYYAAFRLHDKFGDAKYWPDQKIRNYAAERNRLLIRAAWYFFMAGCIFIPFVGFHAASLKPWGQPVPAWYHALCVFLPAGLVGYGGHFLFKASVAQSRLRELKKRALAAGTPAEKEG